MCTVLNGASRVVLVRSTQTLIQSQPRARTPSHPTVSKELKFEDGTSVGADFNHIMCTVFNGASRVVKVRSTYTQPRPECPHSSRAAQRQELLLLEVGVGSPCRRGAGEGAASAAHSPRAAQRQLPKEIYTMRAWNVCGGGFQPHYVHCVERGVARSSGNVHTHTAWPAHAHPLTPALAALTAPPFVIARDK
jgi:hypothetical protein